MFVENLDEKLMYMIGLPVCLVSKEEEGKVTIETHVDGKLTGFEVYLDEKRILYPVPMIMLEIEESCGNSTRYFRKEMLVTRMKVNCEVFKVTFHDGSVLTVLSLPLYNSWR